MELYKTLPFSDLIFLYYALFCTLIILIAKFFLKDKIQYKYVLGFCSLLYISMLYPKPIHILVLVIFLYSVVYSLRKWYRSENLVFPMILISLPMLLMKFFNVLSINEDEKALLNMQYIFQIAGISYLVFKVIGMYIDTRNKNENIKFLDFFNFSLFVPSLLIGPIDRYHRFNNNIKIGFNNINKDTILKGLDELILGLLYKFILSVLIYHLVLEKLNIANGVIIYHISYMYAYLFYLFFDFAGYSLLTLSFARFLGIDLPKNFDKPFLAKNPKEFWKHWHISLGDWLNDYFFKPLFKYFTTKKILLGPQRQGLALFLTFLLMGFWNGFEIHFIASGALFGIFSVIHNFYTIQCKKQNRDVVFGNLSSKFISFISIFIMFNLVAFAIYIFSGNII